MALSAHSESSVLLEAPTDRSGIDATTFDDSGAAVGQSSFALERLPNGNQKMTVRMAIEGGGHTVSEAIFAPVPTTVPSIGPTDRRLTNVAPGGSAADLVRPSSASSAPSSAETIEGLSRAEDTNESKTIAGLRLIEQRSQSTRADGTHLELLIIDHRAGMMTCLPDGVPPNQAQRLTLPKEDRVVNVPMQLFFLPLVRGEVKDLRFQIAMCKEGPALYEMIAVRGPRKKLGEREVLQIRYGPNFGKTVAFFASRLMPTFSFWFDAETNDYLAHRMPLYRDGPEVTLVRAGISPPAIGIDWP